jgi:DNA-binding response OmpR family regulator
MEFDILAYIVQRPQRLISHEELVRCAARTVYRAESSLLRVHVARLRKKLALMPPLIETVRGRGFRVGDHWVKSVLKIPAA